jgi:short-subunit dehydrogenase
MDNPQYIIISGASDGIGKAIAVELAQNKQDLILLGRNETKLQEVMDNCKKVGSKSVLTYAFDLKNLEEIKKFAHNIQTLVIKGIINNAGIWQKKADIDSIPEQELLDVINTNLTGLILLTQKVLPILRKTESSFIINISSRSGYLASVGQSVYAATKYGVRGFTEVLREDLKETNVRVSGIYQGGVNTQMFNKAGDVLPEEKLASFIPPEELAKVIYFLISRPQNIWLPEIRIENR